MSKMASSVEWKRDKISPPQDGACCIIDPVRWRCTTDVWIC